MNTDAHSLEFHLADEEATSELGARLARALDSVKSEILEKGLNIKLVGDLGAGKTYLMRSALTITLKNEGDGRVCDISADSALGNQVLEVLKK